MNQRWRQEAVLTYRKERAACLIAAGMKPKKCIPRMHFFFAVLREEAPG